MVQPGMGQNGPPGTYNNQGPLPSPGNTDEYHEKLKQLRKYIEPMSRVSLETIIVFHNFWLPILILMILDYCETRARSKSQSEFTKYTRNDAIQTRDNKNEIATRYYFRKPSSYSSNPVQM